MFKRTRQGLAIAAASFDVLRQHPQLILLPVLSFASFAVTALGIGGSMYAVQRASLGWPLYVVGWGCFVMATTFLTVFFNAALVSCVLDAFAGRQVSLRAGLMTAVGRGPLILRWALYTVTVGFLIAIVQGMLRKLGILGLLLGNAASMSWSIITYFVVPILVAEGLEPGQAVKRSAEIVKSNWGTAVGTAAGIGILVLLALIPPLLLIGYANAGDMTQPTASFHPLVFAGGIIGVYFLAVLSLFSALGTIFRTGVYFFAKTGELPRGMNRALYGDALR